ncbi:MAG: T9SS type A sorting domain-containing protein [Vicingaceae bacterium]
MKALFTTFLIILFSFANSQDIAVQNLATNFSPCTINSTPVAITLEIANLDTTAIPANQINMRYEVGTNVINEIIATSLPANQSISFQFTTPLNLQAHLGQTITISAQLASDTNLTNNSYVRKIKSAQISLPYFEDFENHTMGTTFNKDELQSWTRSPNQGNILNDFMWRVQKGAAPFAESPPFSGPPFFMQQSGPNGDHTYATTFKNGEGKYLLLNSYLNHSNSPPDATIDLPCNPIVPNGRNLVFVFWYHNHGVSATTVYVDVFNGSTWTLGVDSITSVSAYAALPWNRNEVDLSAFSNSPSLELRFRAKYTNLNLMGGDLAIDDILIYARARKDIGFKEKRKVNNICGINGKDNLALTISNFGSDTLNAIKLSYQLAFTDSIGNESIGPVIIDSVQNIQLVPSSDYFFISNDSLDFSRKGKYDVQAWVSLLGDTLQFNDTLNQVYLNQKLNNNELEDFQNLTLGHKADFYFNRTFPNGWSSNGSGHGFTVHNGNTCPIVAISQSPLDQFLYINKNVNGFGSVFLSSSCFDLTKQVNHDLQFDLYIDDTTDFVLLQYKTPSGPYFNLDTFKGPELKSGWNQISYNIFSLEKKGILSFRLLSINNAVNQIAIDNIGIVDPSPNQIQNLGLTDLDSSSCYYSANETASIEVVNIGINQIDSFQVFLKLYKDSIPSSGISQFYDSAWVYPANFQFGDTQTVVLSPTNLQLDLSQVGSYFITSSVKLHNDKSPKYQSNDTLFLRHDSSRSIPYFEDFQNDSLAIGSNTYQNGFHFNSQFPSSPPSWIITNNSPGFAGPNFDHTLGMGNNNGMFAMNNPQSPIDPSYTFTSPCIDIGGATNPSIDYYVYSWSTFPAQPLDFYLSINDGNGWVLLDSVKGNQQTSPNAPWQRRYLNLPPVSANTHIQLRFHLDNLSSSPGLFAIDDISVRDLFLTDIKETHLNKLSLRPNPSKGQYFIQSEASLAGLNYQVYDLRGQLIQSGNFEGKRESLNLSSQPNGVYFLSIPELKLREKLVKY